MFLQQSFVPTTVLKPTEYRFIMNCSRSGMCTLPTHFVNAMRILFNVMDVNRTGYISYADLAFKWKQLPSITGPNSSLPPGFLDCLWKVTPPNGLLTFERFCAGLRLALAETNIKQNISNGENMNNNDSTKELTELYQNVAEINNIPRYDIGDKHHRHLLNDNNDTKQQENHPNCLHQQQLSSSLEKKRVSMGMSAKLDNRRSAQYYNYSENNGKNDSYQNIDQALKNTLSNQSSPTSTKPIFDSDQGSKKKSDSNYENVLLLQQKRKSKKPSLWAGAVDRNKSNNWHNGNGFELPENGINSRGIPSVNDKNKKPTTALFAKKEPIQRMRRAVPPPPSNVIIQSQNGLEDKSESQKVEFVQQQSRIFRPISSTSAFSNTSSMPAYGQNEINNTNYNNTNLTNRSSNRHTMCEDMAPRIAKHERLLNEEKELTKRGQETTTKLLSWYTQRLNSLQKRAQFLHKGIVALDWAVHEEKLNYLRAHVTEVNRRMVALMETSEHGFPSHINLEVRNRLPQPNDDQLVWVQRQNARLNEELIEKTKLIETLDGEKRQLARRLLTVQQEHRQDITTPINKNSPRHKGLEGRESGGNGMAVGRKPAALVRPSTVTARVAQQCSQNAVKSKQRHLAPTNTSALQKPIPIKKLQATLM